jgi:urease accessory protein
MEVYTKILGNSHSPEWQSRLSDVSIDYIELDQWNAQKSRLLAVGTSGKAYAMAFERGHRLADGDIIDYNESRAEASIVRLKLGDVMVVDLSALERRPHSEAIALAIEIGHAIGNQHWAALIRGNSLFVPLAVDKKVMLSVMRTYNFDGINFSFHPGREIVPFLSPSEIRTLFGSTAPSEGRPHRHHHSTLEEYV